jgi:conjugal transfer ATP-binding protein TraC
MYHRIISLKLLPEQTFATMARALRGLPFDSKLFLSIQVPDQQKELENLQLQRRLAFSMARGKKSGVSDIESEAKLQDLESLISELVAQGEKVFFVSLNILLRSQSEDELDEQVSETLMVLRELAGAEGMEESLAAFDIFSEFAIPNARAKERAKRIKTSNACDLLPIYGPWTGHESPRILLKSTQGSLVGFDPFSKDSTNYNQIVTGGSGSGKSFLTNVLLLQMLKENPKVFIVDIGGSYRKLSDNLSGQYIPFSLNASISINPFDLMEGELTPSSHKIKFLVGLVEMMTKEDGERRIGRLEQAEIEAAIETVYREKAPTLSSLKEVLLAHKDPLIQKYGKILAPWCGSSPFGKMVDHPTTISLERSIVSFDLKGLESVPDLQAVCLYIITDFVWREIQKDRSSMKFLIFDECWKLLENDAGASFIGEVFRTFRKYYASAIAISQNIDDFAKSKVAGAVLPNTSVKWVLMQKGADQNRLKEVLQLNDTEMSQVASLYQERGSMSQAFLMAEDKHSVVQIEPIPLEYWIATTDPRDLAAIEVFHKRNPDLDSLQVLTALSKQYPNGMLGQSLPEVNA